MEQTFKSLDILSNNIVINYKTRPRHGNIAGGILTILIIMCSLGLSIYFSLELVQRENPKAYLVSKFIDDAGLLNFDKQGLFHYIYIRNPLNVITKYDPRMINVTGIVRSDGGSYFGTYLFDQCSYELDFAGLEEYFPESIKERIDTSLCMRTFIGPDGKKQVKDSADANFTYPHGQYGMSSLSHDPVSYTLSINKCVNSSLNNNNCAPLEQINEYYTEKYFAMKFIDNYFDVTDYRKPIVKYVNTINGILGPDHISNNWLNYLKVNLTTQDGLIFDDKKDKESYKFDYRVEIVGASIGDSQILNLNFYLQNMTQFYNRSYMKLQDVLANIGGIVKFFIVAGTILNFFHDKFQTLIDSYEFLSKHVQFDDHSGEAMSSSVQIYNFSSKSARPPERNVFEFDNQKKFAEHKISAFQRGEKVRKLPSILGFSCWRFYLKKESSESKYLEYSKRLTDLFLDINNLFNINLDIIKIKKFLLDNAEKQKTYGKIHVRYGDIVESGANHQHTNRTAATLMNV
jgi:hypothetical protein